MGVCCGQVAYPKRTDKPLYHGLVTQLESCNIPFLAPEDIANGPPLRERFDVVIDAIFGFSFKGAPRPPFDAILEVCPLKIYNHCAVLPQLQIRVHAFLCAALSKRACLWAVAEEGFFSDLAALEAPQ